MYDVVIVGAGVTGTLIARELSRYKLNVAILEKENDVANGTTKANTGIVHAGYDAEPNTNMAHFNAKANPMFDKLCEELDVPFKRIGSLVVGFDEEDVDTIKKLYDRGQKNGIPKLEIIDKNKIKEIEPNIGEKVKIALYAPTAGIISPWELAIAAVENAMENGVELFLNTQVKNISKNEEGYIIETATKNFNSKYIINCAGLYSDKMNNMVSNKKINITPRRGQYFVLDKNVNRLMNTVIFQCPKKYGKGVVITPTVHGNIMVGPDNEVVSTKESKQTTQDSLNYIKQVAQKSIKGIPFNKNITNFAGLRAQPDGGDFIIEEAEDAKGFINVAGIKSPGLTSSPAIAEYVLDMIKDISGGLEEKDDFNPMRRRVIRFDELSDEEKDKLIKKDARYGTIICRCENITEAEIVDCIHRKAGATTVDGVKKRVRPGSGRCQGGFCSPRVMEILARELNKDMKDIVKDNENSYILVDETKKNVTRGTSND